jgi:serine/threonine protein kinase
LGSGGFGDVYEARDRNNGSTVALKRLRRVDPSSLLQFKREFRRVAQLVHRNLVRLYELVEEGDHWFFTMELVHGTHALDYLRTQASARREAALRSTFSQLATAVEVLHGAGIIHRDIKPSNVMVEQDGRVVLLDFGIAKEIGPIYGQVTSVLVGTPDYLAPERLHRVPAREPSDWYSLGVMLYQGLTGTLPFDGDWLRIALEKQERAIQIRLSRLPATCRGI